MAAEDLKQHWEELTMNLVDIIQYEEGFRSKPYLCSEGYVTIGFGTKLHKAKNMNPRSFPIKVSISMATEWLHEEIVIKDIRLSQSSVTKAYSKLSADRQAIIVSMAYQLGTLGVVKFRRMWAALRDENYHLASLEMLGSRWARQTPKRASRHAQVMRHGRISTVYAD